MMSQLEQKKSEEIVAELAKGYNIRIHVRRSSEGRGLSSAVLLGFGLASHDILVCMDADLQHEPEAVPAMVQPILTGRADFAIGSRHIDQGGVGFEWSIIRRIISRGATLLARPLTSSTDPMSGFFCIHKTTLNKGLHLCNPRGFKIALELMVRCQCSSVKDVPIVFRERLAGESKLSMKQNIEYIKQLVALYIFLYGRLMLALLFLFFALVLSIFPFYKKK
uniref:Dolichol-phosphate mannosyltransferase subunit 1 n=1 Tax=Aureoumbra lagunensis TaxID=44058 RepID=A0A7S3JR58_9STRA